MTEVCSFSVINKITKEEHQLSLDFQLSLDLGPSDDNLALPEDLLEKIFCRLSVLDVARARLVCRSWQSVISSRDFSLRYRPPNNDKWVAVYDNSGPNKHRILLLYNATMKKWHRICLDFLPHEFTDAVAAVGGLLCVSGFSNGRCLLCVCNPLTRSYKILPDLDQEPSMPVVVMMEGQSSRDQFRVFALCGDKVALYSSAHGNWQSFSTGLPYRPRSPVACEGVVYGLQNMGSPWKSSWRLVFAELNNLAKKEVWRPLNRPEWGEILDILRQPRLLESNGCLLLTGGLRDRMTDDSCSTFIILKLDLATLEWSEAERMPFSFYKYFDPAADFKVFGGKEMVYISSKKPGRLVVCDFSGAESVWRWVEDSPSHWQHRSDLCIGFPFEPRFDESPEDVTC